MVKASIRSWMKTKTKTSSKKETEKKSLKKMTNKCKCKFNKNNMETKMTRLPRPTNRCSK